MKKGDLVVEASKGYPPVFRLKETPRGDRVQAVYVGDLVNGRLDFTNRGPADRPMIRLVAGLTLWTPNR